ncbi:MAG: L-aspartate oxidase [Sulfurimonas sp. RIFCSPHIGHO2_12_FULL_36_9]|uniref:L-aspartate oxidase n=1 Tax=Sulfurimonas sp. RIFCSPLOWO2_12_36_12 TaxID=1802253 RepID=UPI0008B67D34|nr:L-aspartate oxidase [Sulfurimonas sp. RIFCSPLOWO2_12_36_12]OHD97500.1 MAG: L-aspartate oxidase [Sulfurimonas sp. RIFCSPHIGHO2_12_FULL_36_9]OHE00140.1 MAG: L-aspartate oxidase [Sulfurimonas sp. RIFCSPLOWO2_02_FULL_36_28]OHE02966.1 MAG: L-aspartate oxidase [Sulfurimonas sp. RIFCSPLOWO2_12_36_12]OHE07894.1 MAG: L-aspartate oxidase [Sulfurimonas sp. RIFCSPLOWO2_12_FULL_36_74]
MKYDVIIVGAGVAGLYAAMHLPREKKVLIINKRETFKCNSFYAQGGIALAIDKDDVPLHIKDTLDAGAGLCSEEAVRVLSESSRGVIDDLIARGFEFDKDRDGKLLYTKEAAHSKERILHAGGDATGRYMHYFLLEQNPHPMLTDARVVDLLIKDGECYGVTVLDHRESRNIYADNVIIASGGVGSLYAYHTNAPCISADMQGLCVIKGIELNDMEMMQFHPTVYVDNDSAQKLLLTEALRGEGATVEDEKGRRFLFDYDERGELASRDIVSKAIYDHNKKTGLQTYLSFKNFDHVYFTKRFPNLYKNLQLLGFDVPKQRVPISPAFHYAIGGIKTDINGAVPSVKSLYAIGEVASTKVHGANRLASNSLLEGLVFGKRAVEDILKKQHAKKEVKFEVADEVMSLKEDKEKKNLLRKIMWENVSIVRTKKGLNSALNQINALLNEKIGKLLKFRLLTAKEIVLAALARDESIGVHYIKKDDSD